MKTYDVPFRVNENDSNLTKNGAKRMSKPQMEKRRRARINTCLNQLKEMVIDSGKQNIQVIVKWILKKTFDKNFNFLNNGNNSEFTLNSKKLKKKF